MKLQILANHLQSVKNSSVENSSARVVPIPEKVRVCFFVFSWFVSFCFVFLFFVLFFSFSLCVCVCACGVWMSIMLLIFACPLFFLGGGYFTILAKPCNTLPFNQSVDRPIYSIDHDLTYLLLFF